MCVNLAFFAFPHIRLQMDLIVREVSCGLEMEDARAGVEEQLHFSIAYF